MEGERDELLEILGVLPDSTVDYEMTSDVGLPEAVEDVVDDAALPDALDTMFVMEESILPTAPEMEMPEPSTNTPTPELPNPQVQIEVAVPSLDEERLLDYEAVLSDVVEAVLQQIEDESGQLRYVVEFTDGRQEEIDHDSLLELDKGKASLLCFWGVAMPLTRKRKRSIERWNSESSDSDSDRMTLDGNDDPQNALQETRDISHSRRSTRSREPNTRQSSTRRPAPVAGTDEDGNDSQDSDGPPIRQLRTRRPQRQATLVSYRAGGYSDEQDELADDSHIAMDDFDDMPIVTSDIVVPSNRRKRPQRVSARSGNRKPQKKSRKLDDIEFEAPRRSSRATKAFVNMGDDWDDDDESFFVEDTKPPGVAKVISIREVFQPITSESSFPSMHSLSCHTCGGSKNKGQLIHCQGCSLSWHKNCLGYRSAREHMVTKVGEDDFVLQCKYCIGLYRKKDKNAPRYDACQECQKEGKACAAFSQKKTSRQEEKIREENGGTDPITAVEPALLNNSDLVMFRCVSCHRGWHIEHLPVKADSVATDVKEKRLKDYSRDWRCKDCSAVKHKIHRLVAWRLSGASELPEGPPPLCTEVDEDSKEYLVKWEQTSYRQCTWKPGAWIYGFAANAMRTAFAKRDATEKLLRMSKEEAVPDEFLMPDIILNVKFRSSIPRPKTRDEEIESIADVSKIYVKFQGLGYDDVVWDSPPPEESGDIHRAYLEAFYDYVLGKYFHHESLAKIKDRVRAYKESKFEEVEVQPQGLQRGRLMGYQLEGLNWLLKNYHHSRNVVLADEMGLGKTVQVISLVSYLVQDEPQCWPFLIVVPNATCPNWRREFKQWTPDLRVVTYHGGKAPQELAYKHELFPDDSVNMKAHVVIMSYDSAQDPQTRVLFKSVSWQGLVVDEGQRLKNDQNLLYVALRAMKIPFRLLLTGTPLQNNKRELFNLIQFIDDRVQAEKLDAEYEILDKETLPKLHERIRPYFLRRTKAGVLKFLPPMSQIIVPVTMTSLQEKLSKSIMAKNPQLIKAMFSNSKLARAERGSLNNILMQLRKCLCHPFMYSDAIEEQHDSPEVIQRNLIEASAKLILMELMLPRLKERGHRVLIFSQFLQQLDIVEDFLIDKGYGFRRLDGSMSSLEKQKRIDAFNAPDSELFAFLLSTRAGGVGINLATADTVIIMDPDFNPHQDMQALSRAHRIGQKSRVLCFQLVTKDSVEERIMQIGRKKMALDHALIESMDDDDLAGDDLESILKHGASALFNDEYQKTAIKYDAASVDKLLDRSDIEQTKTDEEGSSDTQFTYARVWANDKGLEDSLGFEDEAPEPLNSSVWDSIIAEREAEAERARLANQEVLGRGSRRRAPANYKASAISNAVLGDVDDHKDRSDSGNDGEFTDAESADSEDDEAVPKGKKRKAQPKSLSEQKSSVNTPNGKLSKNRINKNTKQTSKTHRQKSLRLVGRRTKTPEAKFSTPKKKPTATEAQEALQVPTPPASAKKAKQGQVRSQLTPCPRRQRMPSKSGEGSRSHMGNPSPTTATSAPVGDDIYNRQLASTIKIHTSSSTETSDTMDNQ